MTRTLLRIFLLATLLLPQWSARLSAQTNIVESYKFDAGLSLGMSGYLGDANSSNPFLHPGFAANAGMRYLINSRFAAKAQLSYASLSGNTADMDNVLPAGAQYSFKSSVFDLGLRGECNFFAYGIGETYKRLRRWTPYLTIGIGCTMSSTSGQNFFAMNIPMGFGFKYKLKPRLNLVAEFTMTKVFGDHVDSPELSDLYHIKSSFLKNTDWYSSLTVGFTYEFGPRCVTCHRID